MVRSSRALLLHIYMANNNFRDVSTTSTSVRPGLLYRSGNVLNGKLPIGCTPRRILDLRSEEEHESDEAWQAAVAPGGGAAGGPCWSSRAAATDQPGAGLLGSCVGRGGGVCVAHPLAMHRLATCVHIMAMRV